VLGIALVSLPTFLAISWAIQHRFPARYLACLAAGLACGAALAALFAVIGERATFDPHASSSIANWSGMVGAAVGLVTGWVTGTVTGPAVLLRLLGIRLDAGRLILAILTGVALSALLVYLLEFFNPRGSAMSLVAALSSAATFAALTLAARDRSA
jgi:hypothetical protein